MEAQALDRSKLEQKDRAELAAIVEAMGGKATSRAKKADLVDQVLQLAGVAGAPHEAGEEAGGEAGAGADAVVSADPVDPGDAGPSLPEPEVIVPHGAVGSDEEAPAEWELAFEAESAEVDTAVVRSHPDRGRQQSGGQHSGGQHSGGQQSGGQQSGGQPRGQAGAAQGGGQPRGQGAGQQGGQGGQGQQGGSPDGEGEGGNRRRRRRGRDRNRGADGLDAPVTAGQGGGQPQGPVDRPGPERAEEFVGEPVEVSGYLDLRDEGYGFLRVSGYLPSKDDVYVSVKQVRQLGLRRGDHLRGAGRPAGRNEKNPALLRIDEVNGKDPETARNRRRFQDLTPVFPDSRLTMELPGDPGNTTARIIDLLAPIGKGQRGLIVSPPRAGTTTVLKQIARSIELNHPDVHLIVLLVDERPEEVTDFRTWLARGEVAASTFDRPSEEHTQVAELTIERAKRMVEDGQDVVVLLDGITRLARAYNLTLPTTDKVMSGGIDAGALYPPKKLFGAARNCEEGGSLTILATALVETNSRMDDAIFEEFQGRGNMELKLDRELAERRIYPAIDAEASSTLHEELLYAPAHLAAAWKLRRVLSALAAESGSAAAGSELLTERMKTFTTNDEFLAEVDKAPSGA